MIYLFFLNDLMKECIFLQTKHYSKLFYVSQDVCQEDGYLSVV